MSFWLLCQLFITQSQLFGFQRNEVLKEYPAAALKLEDLLNNASGISSFEENAQIGSPKKFRTVSQIHFWINDSRLRIDKVLGIDEARKKKGFETITLISGESGSASKSYRLSRLPDRKNYTVDFVGPTNNEMNDFAYVDLTRYTSTAFAFDGEPYRQLFEEPAFQIKKVDKIVKDGQEQIVVEFDFRPTFPRSARFGSGISDAFNRIQGNVTFRPSKLWVATSYNVTMFPKNGSKPFDRSMTLKLRDDSTETPILESVLLEWKVANPLTYEMKFEELRFSKPEDKLFLLANFGYPNLDDSTSNLSKLVLYLVAGPATFFVLLLLIMRILRRKPKISSSS